MVEHKLWFFNMWQCRTSETFVSSGTVFCFYLFIFSRLEMSAAISIN